MFTKYSAIVSSCIAGFILFAIAAAIFMAHSVTDENEPPVEIRKRVIIKEKTLLKNEYYTILEVDGVEYLATGSGGLYPLVKPCK